ncbi:MAG: hypothetical protein WC530_10520 [Candidatus Omnitrophota bacterium]|jgi:phosphoserine phosphatase
MIEVDSTITEAHAMDLTAKGLPVVAEYLGAMQNKINDLEARGDKLETALHKIKDWSDAYQIEVFPEPNWNEVKDKLGDKLLTRVSASNMRHAIKGAGNIAKEALA